MHTNACTNIRKVWLNPPSPPPEKFLATLLSWSSLSCKLTARALFRTSVPSYDK